jgi:hypothetical protein
MSAVQYCDGKKLYSTTNNGRWRQSLVVLYFREHKSGQNFSFTTLQASLLLVVCRLWTYMRNSLIGSWFLLPPTSSALACVYEVIILYIPVRTAGNDGYLKPGHKELLVVSASSGLFMDIHNNEHTLIFFFLYFRIRQLRESKKTIRVMAIWFTCAYILGEKYRSNSWSFVLVLSWHSTCQLCCSL